MIYSYYKDKEQMPKHMEDVLQRYFPENTWGASVLMCNGVVDVVTIYRVKITGKTKYGGTEMEWTHYANIQYLGRDWEINEQFMGEKENEMWVYGTYKSFGGAVRGLATKGNSEKNRKPILKF